MPHSHQLLALFGVSIAEKELPEPGDDLSLELGAKGVKGILQKLKVSKFIENRIQLLSIHKSNILSKLHWEREYIKPTLIVFLHQPKTLSF